MSYEYTIQRGELFRNIKDRCINPECKATKDDLNIIPGSKTGKAAGLGAVRCKICNSAWRINVNI